MSKLLSLFFISLMVAACQPVKEQGKSDIEKNLERIGLQNVAEEISGIEVYYMVYATPYNSAVRRV